MLVTAVTVVYWSGKECGPGGRHVRQSNWAYRRPGRRPSSIPRAPSAPCRTRSRRCAGRPSCMSGLFRRMSGSPWSAESPCALVRAEASRGRPRRGCRWAGRWTRTALRAIEATTSGGPSKTLAFHEKRSRCCFSVLGDKVLSAVRSRWTLGGVSMPNRHVMARPLFYDARSMPSLLSAGTKWKQQR